MTPIKTKIVCSMGPTTENDEILKKIIQNGMNIARFNFSHGNHEYHKSQMERVRKLSDECKKSVALMMDTKGPEIRTGNTVDNQTVLIQKGETISVTVDDALTTPNHISINWKECPEKIKSAENGGKGIKILIADGLLELEVQCVQDDTVICVAKNSAKIGNKKNVNLIGIHANLPIMSEQDKEDIKLCAAMDCDYLAASFVSYASEIHEIRRYLEKLKSNMKIIAKIENEEGLNNITQIVEAADGIMVARGDLGVQLPTERIPLAQKKIISECRRLGKPVITATQMLDSMITNPRPTRAELTDVANAIFDGTDAVMLSGETANGSYPAEAVETMARIAGTVENSEEYQKKMHDFAPSYDATTIGQNMAQIAFLTAQNIQASAILVPTLSGHTAEMISKFRPNQLIVAVTPNKDVQRKLLLNWGIFPLYIKKAPDDSEEMIQNAVKKTLESGLIHTSEKIVLCAGIPLQSPIPVNTIRVMMIGNILARGRYGGSLNNEKKTGRIVKAKTPSDALKSIRHKEGEILLCPTLDEDWMPILRLVDGVIVKGQVQLDSDFITMANPNITWISEVSAKDKCMETGLTVTIDPKDLLIYEGLI